MSKAADKLAKLAGFGMLAGAEPAASARQVLKAAEAAEAPGNMPPEPKSAESPVNASRIAQDASPEIPPGRAGGRKREAVAAPKAQRVLVAERENLTRNVVFLPADQEELDRIEDLLRSAGIRKPTIADLVRVALRAAKPTSSEAAGIFQEAKALDARRAANKQKNSKSL